MNARRSQSVEIVVDALETSFLRKMEVLCSTVLMTAAMHSKTKFIKKKTCLIFKIGVLFKKPKKQLVKN